MLYISRNLDKKSPLRYWAEEHELDLLDLSFLQFTLVNFDLPEASDWWFYYSPRAVTFSVHRLPIGTMVGAIGGSTAAQLLDHGIRIDFCGNGVPRQTAEDFLAVAEGQRVFFPRARRSRKSVQDLLHERLIVQDAVCYDNRIVPPYGAIEASIYIFTSPLNVSAYLDRYTLTPGAKILAIGPSTGGELLRRGVPCEWPTEPSEKGLLTLLG